MCARLNENLSTKYLSLTAKAALDNITQLLFISELLKARLVEQSKKYCADGAVKVRVTTQLKVAQDCRVWIHSILSSWVHLGEVENFFLGEFDHRLINLKIISA